MMHSALAVTTPAAVAPVDINLVRSHCRIDHSADDLLLSGYIAAAVDLAEAYLNRTTVIAGYTWTVLPVLPFWPRYFGKLDGTLELPRAPVQSVSAVSVLDTDGNATALTSANYLLNTTLEPARLWLDPDTLTTGGSTLRGTRLQQIQVQFTAGWDTTGALTPQVIKLAIMMLAAHIYEHRGDTPEEMPAAPRRLLDRYRVTFFAG